MPPIHPQIRARHKTTRPTQQKHRRAPIFLRPRQPPQHILRGPLDLPLREPLEQLLHHSRDNVPWRNGVNADVMWPPFSGEVAPELDDAGFGGVVGGADEVLQTIKHVSWQPWGNRNGGNDKARHTLFAILPLILAINTTLPPFPNRIICLAHACAVINTPVILTSNMRFASSAVYSSAGVSC
jgi:hypothetical protein